MLEDPARSMRALMVIVDRGVEGDVKRGNMSSTVGSGYVWEGSDDYLWETTVRVYFCGKRNQESSFDTM